MWNINMLKIFVTSFSNKLSIARYNVLQEHIHWTLKFTGLSQGESDVNTEVKIFSKNLEAT